MTYSHGQLAIFDTPRSFGQAFSGQEGPLGTFAHLFPALVADPDNRLPETDTAATTRALMALGAAMIDTAEADDQDMNVAPIQTYMGQFLDHDVTLQGTDSKDNAEAFDINPAQINPLSPDDLTRILRNGRDPRLNLDSLYGPRRDKKALPMRENGTKFELAEAPSAGEEGPIPEGDLPRFTNPKDIREALIGDKRNDENLLVAQLHLAFMAFHNRVVDKIKNGEVSPPDIQMADGASDDQRVFAQAKRLVCWHYQWILLNDYLTKICDPQIVADLRNNIDSFPHFEGMPLEFAGAAFRFGHSMVREKYNHNHHFPGATFKQLFEFTGAGGFFGLQQLPSNWVIDWPRFIDPSVQKARRIDTVLAKSLGNMINERPRDGQEGIPGLPDLMKMLAQRNLLRGYLMSLPTGEAVATALGETPLTPDQLAGNPEIDQIMADGGFVGRTPLWYYVLKEAELNTDSEGLGAVGSKLVAGTFIRLLMSDSDSILNSGQNWSPSDGVGVSTAAELVMFS